MNFMSLKGVKMWEKFKKLCDEKGVKPNNVAKIVGIASGTITNWKNGKCVPKIDKLRKVADYFNVPLYYFLNENELPSVDGYWLDNETAELAQEIFENQELRLLFNSARDCKPEDLKVVHDMLLALKRKEKY